MRVPRQRQSAVHESQAPPGFFLSCCRQRDERASSPVIDGDDLLENPHGIVEAYCNVAGIPCIEAALSREPGSRDEISCQDGDSWHANLRDSDGFKPQPRRYIDDSKAPSVEGNLRDLAAPLRAPSRATTRRDLRNCRLTANPSVRKPQLCCTMVLR
jgi:hypothetical protein